MRNTYTHRIISLKKENGFHLNIIKSFVIEVTASDGENQISEEYTIYLEEPNDNFVGYEAVREEDLISWYKSETIQKDFVTADIDKKLKEHTQDTVESNFPWS